MLARKKYQEALPEELQFDRYLNERPVSHSGHYLILGIILTRLAHF